MNISKLVIVSASLAALAATAADANPELVREETSPKNWSLRVGYAWRERATTDFSAQRSLPPGGQYLNGSFSGSLEGSPDWTFGGNFDEGRYVDDNYGNTPLYSMALERRESVGGGSSEDSAHGANIALGFDCWRNDYLVLSAVGRLAGYWNVCNGARGGYRQYFDNYSFNQPLPEWGIGTPSQDAGSEAKYEDRTYGFGGANPRMELKADLYQIGLGPEVTWHAFKGWCGCMDWLDVYGGAEILCNIVHSDFSAGAASANETECLIGFGGHLGLLGNVTDWCGIYGQIGYEWVDKSEVSAAGCTAETDFSSLVLSAGVQFRF